MNIENYCIVVAFVITFFIIKILKPIARLVELVDKPGGRKKHIGCVPLVGGIAIFIGVSLISLIFIEQTLFVRIFLLACGLMVFIGMIDDRYQLSARSRLVGQFLISCMFVYGLDLHIYTFGNVFGFGEVAPGWIGYPLTVLSLMAAINAFNMLDGMDGLVGSISLISFAGAAFLFASNGSGIYQLLCIALIGAISAFLIFNIWGRTGQTTLGKIFMGDAGSMFMGLALAVLLIAGTQGTAPAFKPIVAVWFVLLPLTDMFTLMYRRVKRGRSPMTPDRTHIHHIIMRAGFAPKQTLNLIILIQLALVGIGIMSQYWFAHEWMSAILAIAFVAAYQLLMKRSWRFIRWNKRRFSAA